MEEYEVYHDEYKGNDKVDEYWHGLYFVPKNKRNTLVQDLKEVRDEYKIPHHKDFKFAGSLKSQPASRFLTQNLSIFKHSLIVRDDRATTELINFDKGRIFRKEFEPYKILRGTYGCKFVLLKIPCNHKGMDSSNFSYADRVEKTFRFAFKSGAHGLFNENIKFVKFYFDGNEHHGRGIDINEITKGPWREHISFADNICIDDRQITNRDTDSKLMINLVDNIIGSLASKINQVEDPRRTLSIYDDLLDRVQSQQIITNKNGRWYKSISLSQMFTKDDGFDFKNIFHHPEQGVLGL